MFLSFLNALFYLSMTVLIILEFHAVPELPWGEGHLRAAFRNCIVGSILSATIGIGIWIWIRVNRKREIKNGRNQTGILWIEIRSY